MNRMYAFKDRQQFVQFVHGNRMDAQVVRGREHTQLFEIRRFVGVLDVARPAQIRRIDPRGPRRRRFPTVADENAADAQRSIADSRTARVREPIAHHQFGLVAGGPCRADDEMHPHRQITGLPQIAIGADHFGRAAVPFIDAGGADGVIRPHRAQDAVAAILQRKARHRRQQRDLR